MKSKTEKSKKDDVEETKPRWQDPGAPRSLMDELEKVEGDLYDVYHVKIKFENMILGPAPASLDALLAKLNSAKSRKLIPESVLENFKAEMVARYAVAEQARVAMLTREAEGGEEEDAPKPNAVKDVEAKGLSVFMIDWDGIYLESRAVKSMIRDVMSMQSVFTQHGREKTFHNLGLFVRPAILRFTRDGKTLMAPDDVRHYPAILKGPNGAQNAIVSNEFLVEPYLEFQVLLTRYGRINQSHLIRCLAAAKLVGLGARRSQGFGQFTIEECAYLGTRNEPVEEDMRESLRDMAAEIAEDEKKE
jgi:hypothetical protein